MIIGFGEEEVNTARRIIDECIQAISLSPKNAGQALAEVQERYMEKSNRYKKMSREDTPERYTQFWARLSFIRDGKYIVEFAMHHINRRHPLSPDGWALLATHWILSVDPNYWRIFKEV